MFLYVTFLSKIIINIGKKKKKKKKKKINLPTVMLMNCLPESCLIYLGSCWFVLFLPYRGITFLTVYPSLVYFTLGLVGLCRSFHTGVSHF